MTTKRQLGFFGFGLAILGGYFWMINQIPLSLILWGGTFLIIAKLNRMKKKSYSNRKKFK